jgi:membrane protein implicated in regulation of membrane protease activity
MPRIPWPQLPNQWLWLCPGLAVLVAACVLWVYGFSWWSALLAAAMLACPLLILWGVVQIARDERRQRAVRRSAGLIPPKERIR